jgi:hypothetical protein
MEHSIVDDSAVFQMLHDDALQKIGRHSGIPHTLGIDDDDRSVRAHAEARRLPTLYTVRPKEKTFPLEQLGKRCVQSTAASLR